MNERLLSTAETAALIGIAPHTLRCWRMAGRGPRYLRLSETDHGRCMYSPAEVQRWVEKRMHASTAAEAAARVEAES